MHIFKKLNKALNITPVPLVLKKERQLELLAKYSTPIDLIERSYFQFKIQFHLFGYSKRLINNIIGFFALLYFVFNGLLRSLFIKNGDSHSYDTGAMQLAIFPYKNFHYPDIIPNELKNEFIIEKVNYFSGSLLMWNDLKFIFSLIQRYPFSYYFLSKCVSKICFYRFLIQKYKPAAIISASEYTFSSSILTLFCRKASVEHINIMHGEKFFFLRDSFFEFDRFYIWDIFYKQLFINLRASPGQFIIGTFPNLKMNLQNSQPKYSYTYYLAPEDKKTMKKVKETLQQLDSKSNICIRCHPRYSKKEEVHSIFEGFNIEDPMTVSLEESFRNTNCVISLYSSCLAQAYFSGKKIIIDDVNHDSEIVKSLKEYDYIIFSKPHILLSTISNFH